MSTIIVFVLTCSAAFVAFKLGQISGRENARAEGWLERWGQEQARDRARRNRLGQFKGKGAQS